MSKERRVHARYNVNWRSRVLLLDRSIRPAQITNVSKGGLYVIFAHAISIGTEICVEFHVEYRGETHRIRAKTIVTYSAVLSENRGAGLGVQFTEIDSKSYHVLNNVIQTLADSCVD